MSGWTYVRWTYVRVDLCPGIVQPHSGRLALSIQALCLRTKYASGDQVSPVDALSVSFTLVNLSGSFYA